MQIIVVGHVDHGKSTIVGRLLADTGSLPQEKLEELRAACERAAKPHEYAFPDAGGDRHAGLRAPAARHHASPR
jgi:bifunctional enzyme CysN/CysC